MSSSEHVPAETALIVSSGGAAAVQALPQAADDHLGWTVELSDAWADPWRSDPAYQVALSCLNQAGDPREENRSWPWIGEESLRRWLARVREEAEKVALLPAVYADAGTFGDVTDQNQRLRAYRYVRSVAVSRVGEAWFPNYTIPAAPDPGNVLDEVLPQPTAREVDPARRPLRGAELVRSREATRVLATLKQADLHLGPGRRIVVVVGPRNWSSESRNLFTDTILAHGTEAHRRTCYGSVESTERHLRLEYVGFLRQDLQAAVFGSLDQNSLNSLDRLASRLSRFCAPKQPAAAEELKRQSAATGTPWPTLLQSELRAALLAGLQDLKQPRPTKIGSYQWVKAPSGERWEGRPVQLASASTPLEFMYFVRQLIAKSRAAITEELRASAVEPSDGDAPDAMDHAERYEPHPERTPLHTAAPAMVTQSPDPEPDFVSNFETRELIRTCLARADLSATVETDLRLHALEGLSYQEIADRTGQTEDAVKQAVYEGRKELGAIRDRIA